MSNDTNIHCFAFIHHYINERNSRNKNESIRLQIYFYIKIMRDKCVKFPIPNLWTNFSNYYLLLVGKEMNTLRNPSSRFYKSKY